MVNERCDKMDHFIKFAEPVPLGSIRVRSMMSQLIRSTFMCTRFLLTDSPKLLYRRVCYRRIELLL